MTVEADLDYSFATTVVIPTDAEPDDARLIARRPETYPFVANPDPALHISDVPPVQPRSTAEGGSRGAAPSQSSAVSAGHGSPPGTIGSTDADVEDPRPFARGWVWAGLVLGAAVALCTWLLFFRSTCDPSHRQE